MAIKSKRSSRKKFTLFVRVLQNGVSIGDLQIPTKEGRTLRFSEIASRMPFPIIELDLQYRLLEISKQNTVLLFPQSNWKGFVASQGNVADFATDIEGDEPIKIGPSDYATITLQNCSVLLRVDEFFEKKGIKVVADRSYAGKILDVILPGKQERRHTALGMFLASSILAGMISLVLFASGKPPSNMEELHPNYALTFISPVHLELAPEALQQNLVQSKVVALISRYYTSFAEMILGQQPSNPELLAENSISRSVEIANNHRMKQEKLVSEQVDLSEIESQKPSSGLLSIPLVSLGSVQASAINIMAKIRNHHTALKQDFARRSTVTKEYNKITKDYVETEYRGMASDSPTAQYLSQIRMTNALRPEEKMYVSAAMLAKRASFQQKPISSKSKHQKSILDSSVIAVGVPAEWLDPQRGPRANYSDGKMNEISAINWDERGLPPKEQRLTGDLPKKLIKRTISKRKFELQLCYELALRRNQSSKGETEWSWIIDRRGRTTDINLIFTSIEDRSLISCIRGKLAKWVFPRPENGSVKVRNSFRFAPSKG